MLNENGHLAELAATHPFPPWLARGVVNQSGSSINVVCPTCGKSAVISARFIELHWRHLSPHHKVIAWGETAAIAQGYKGYLAKPLTQVQQWLSSTAEEPELFDALSEILGERASASPTSVGVDVLTARCMEAAGARTRLLAVYRAVKAEDADRVTLEEAARSQLPFLKLAVLGHPGLPLSVLRILAADADPDIRQAAERLHEGRDEPTIPGRVAPVEPEARMVGGGDESDSAVLVQVAPPDHDIELDLIARLAALAGLMMPSSSDRWNRQRVWLLRDERPIIGGSIVVCRISEEDLSPEVVRDVIRRADDAGAIRSVIVVRGEIGDSLRAYALHRPVVLVSESDLALPASAPLARSLVPTATRVTATDASAPLTRRALREAQWSAKPTP